jgi:hypothetical protein
MSFGIILGHNKTNILAFIVMIVISKDFLSRMSAIDNLAKRMLISRQMKDTRILWIYTISISKVINIIPTINRDIIPILSINISSVIISTHSFTYSLILIASSTIHMSQLVNLIIQTRHLLVINIIQIKQIKMFQSFLLLQIRFKRCPLLLQFNMHLLQSHKYTLKRSQSNNRCIYLLPKQ